MIVEGFVWNINATLILMNTVRGCGLSVPRSISLELLAEVAVLVDYYVCHETVGVYVDRGFKV
ncbi:hypothetical protein EV126DRAFT_424282 [Verticillium dahliae]|nr:hypothetical protein EV126DRAFT_424272 [Verticillium dahliae]KAH6699598.1 hypothetical protein EV126DRAFT_424282 [Verticillium dahliae]